MIAHGPDRTDSLLERGYGWTHHHFPHIIDCQPIDAEQFLEKAGFWISAQAELETWTIPVIAARSGSQSVVRFRSKVISPACLPAA